MPNNTIPTLGVNYFKPVYFGHEEIGLLKGQPVGVQVTLIGMAMIAANSPYGSKELVVRFEESNRPLTRLLSVVENIITAIESVYDDAEPTCKDIGGYHYRLIKQLGINLNEFIKDNKEYTLHDVQQILDGLPPTLFKATLVATATH